MRKSHGFTLLREVALHEVGGIARLWKHDATGAELLSVCNEDENKSFGVSFRTPPKDSTGVAHILEHSVLCGSARYPVKEPFVELLKSSLQTFLNALTFPDKTCYPVASANVQDFYNLIDVYVDAVFHPRIDADVLRQEGWHIDVADDGTWSYKGVVFNEMKGVYSSPDSVLMEESQHAVFPDTLYALDSGGNPPEILSLSYEAFRDFHSRYYHPSNARFFFWGDDPEDKRLEKIEAALADFTRIEVDSAVPLQERRSLARKLEIPYAAAPTCRMDEGENEEQNDQAGADNADARQGHVTVSWLLCESGEVEELLVLEMLEHILAGLPGSPLRKALMDSGLGEDVTGAGLETDLRQAYFSLGLRSMRPADADAMETLIMDTLAALAGQGIPRAAVDAAVNSLEFELRENNTGRFPRGLAAMFRSLTTWLYDGDPFTPLAWEAPLASIKSRLARGEKVFEHAIRRWLLENPHRVTVVLTPDAGLAEARQKAEDERIRAVRAAMTPEEQAETARVSARLHDAQEKPDSPEALATIPSLGLADLPQRNAPLPCVCRNMPPDNAASDRSPAFTLHELDTTGIVYAKLLLPLDAVPASLLPLVPLYARALTELGTTRHTYVELGMETAAHTGGLSAYPSLHARLTDASALAMLTVSGKATEDKAARLADLMREILLDPSFDNRDRFTQILLEEKARLEQSVIPSGHSLVSTRLDAGLSIPGRLAEATGGVSYLGFVRDLTRRVETRWAGVRDDLKTLHRLIARGDAAVVSLTAEGSALAKAEPLFGDVARALPAGPHPLPKPCETWAHLPAVPETEALLAQAQVNYVGMGMNLRQAGYAFHGSASVVLRHLRMGYLWERVRVQGGAYGAYANYSRATGSLVFLSYRDPNVERTLEMYRRAADYLGNLSLSREDVTRAIVGAIGDMDAYMLPGAKGNAALWRTLTGDTEAIRQRIRDEILATTLEDFHAFAPYLARAAQHARVCALGGPAVEESGKKQGWTLTRVL